MKEDFLGISSVNLGVLKSAFLTIGRENILYTGVLSRERILEYLKEISTLSKEEKMNIIIKIFNDIYTGNIKDEKRINEEEAYLVLLLKSIPFEKNEADYYWKERSTNAICRETKNVLIEIAAMHPLIDGKPGKEFQEHLEQAIELYKIEKEKGNNPIMYIPGSLHYIINPQTKIPQIDKEPLSEAGKQFLIDYGIPEESIRANIMNLDYKGEDGVYNSGDECYVACQIARNEDCGRIISVVSPVQLYRKALFYNEFGYNPELYATGTEKTGHNYIGETFWSLYITYMNDQDWQTGFISHLTRKERDIDYNDKTKEYKDIIDELIQNGRKQITKNVLKQKEQWMNLYNIANENMNNTINTKHNILIDLIRTEGKSELEISRIKQIINNNSEAEITVLVKYEDDINDLLEISDKYSNLKIIKLNSNDIKQISSIFKQGDYKKLFGMYPSSISMKQAVEYIRNGVIPIVSSLPDNNPNYVDNISQLFDEVFRLNDNIKIGEK